MFKLKFNHLLLTTLLLLPMPLFPQIDTDVNVTANTVVRVVSEVETASSGEEFTVNIEIEPGGAIAGAQFDLVFDPALVDVTLLLEGNLFSQGGASTYFRHGTIDHQAGTITGCASVIITPGETVATAGTMAVLNVTATSEAGICPFTLSNVVVGDINGQAVPVSLVNDTVTVNQPILDSIGNKIVAAGEVLQFTISGIGSEPLGYWASNLPPGADFNPVTQVFFWTPGLAEVGAYYNIVFAVSNGSLSDRELISIHVVRETRAPVMTSIADQVVGEGVEVAFTVSASDIDGDELTYSAANVPEGGLFNPLIRLFEWLPRLDQLGFFGNIRFTADDGMLRDTADMDIAVLPRPPLPGNAAQKFITSTRSHVDCGNDPSLNTTGQLTIEAWIRPALSGPGCGNGGALAKASSGDPGWAWQLRYRYLSGPDGYLGFQFNADPGSAWVTVNQELVPGNLYYVVGRFDNRGNLSCMVNGVITDTAQVDFLNERPLAPLLIGDDGWGNIFPCEIDEVRISTVFRSDKELIDNWNNGAGRRLEVDEYTVALYHMDEGRGLLVRDESPNGNHGAAFNTIWVQGLVD